MTKIYKYLLLALSLSIVFSTNITFADNQNIDQITPLFSQAIQEYHEKNYENAKAIFISLAKSNHQQAQFYLGTIYDRGLGSEHNIEKAMHWFELSAEHGDPQLQYDLGVRYLYGKGVEPNEEKAIYWWEKAAKTGFPQAQYNLALVYMEGNKKRKANNGKSAKLLQLAAKQGLPNAQYALGLAYTFGQGVPLDLNQAYHFFNLAAEQGHSSAQYNLGALIENGESTEVDLNSAIYWYKKAVKNGSQLAINRLNQLKPKLIKIDQNITSPKKITIHNSFWIKSQPSSSYTIQIGFVNDKEILLKWLETLKPLSPLAYYSLKRQSQTIYYAAIYGVFPNGKIARKALKELPQELLTTKPWIRNLSRVKAEILDN